MKIVRAGGCISTDFGVSLRVVSIEVLKYENITHKQPSLDLTKT